MLHPARVCRALKGNALRQLRILLGIKARPKAPVLAQSLDHVVTRHGMICRDFQRLLPPGFSLQGGAVCEVGPGDCLATAALFASLGAKEINLVELNPPVLSEKQLAALQALKGQGFPLDLGIISQAGAPTLDGERVHYHMKFIEQFDAPDRHDLICSYDVFEHVEDLDSSFRACFAAMKPGGLMLHVIDLGGHGEFEDPLPPLDFQTYGEPLYGWMYPEFHRATRRFVSDYRTAVSAAGFQEIDITPLRSAEEPYVTAIRPRLRAAARAVPPSELAIIEFALFARKPLG